jgi:hypothetical protein
LRFLVSVTVGLVLGFITAALAIAAFVLLATGVGGGILVRSQPGTARVLNYDPSNVVEKALFPGAAALVMFILFIVVARRIGRNR